MATRRRSRSSYSRTEPVESTDAPSAAVAPETSPEPAPAPAPVPEVKSSPPAAPAAPKQMVPLRVFLAAHTVKPDQMAGFASWAKRMKLGPRSIAEWRDTVQKFNRTPVK